MSVTTLKIPFRILNIVSKEELLCTYNLRQILVTCENIVGFPMQLENPENRHKRWIQKDPVHRGNQVKEIKGKMKNNIMKIIQ